MSSTVDNPFGEVTGVTRFVQVSCVAPSETVAMAWAMDQAEKEGIADTHSFHIDRGMNYDPMTGESEPFLVATVFGTVPTKEET